MTILEELWSGTLSAGGKNYYLGEDIKEATTKAAATENALGQLLDSRGKAAFEEYQVCQQELILLIDKATFVRGFQLGARLMLEIIEE